MANIFAMPPNTVSDRLRALLAHVPALSVRDFEILAGLRRGTAQKILDGDSADPRSSTLAALSAATGATVEHLHGAARGPTAEGVAAALSLALRRLEAVTHRVGAAIEGSRGVHTRRVRPRATARQMRTGSVTRRPSRASGASR